MRSISLTQWTYRILLVNSQSLTRQGKHIWNNFFPNSCRL